MEVSGRYASCQYWTRHTSVGYIKVKQRYRNSVKNATAMLEAGPYRPHNY